MWRSHSFGGVTSCCVGDLTVRLSAHWARSVQTQHSRQSWSGWMRRRRRRAAAGRGQSSDPDSLAPRSAPAGGAGGLRNQMLPYWGDFRVTMSVGFLSVHRITTSQSSPGSTSISDTWCWLAEADQEAACRVPVRLLAGPSPCLPPGAPGRTERWCGRRGMDLDRERLNGCKHGHSVGDVMVRVMSHRCDVLFKTPL